jgi:hypothetical protein
MKASMGQSIDEVSVLMIQSLPEAQPLDIVANTRTKSSMQEHLGTFKVQTLTKSKMNSFYPQAKLERIQSSKSALKSDSVITFVKVQQPSMM